MKKVLAVVFAMMFALCLVACGDDDGDGNGNGSSSSEITCTDGSKVKLEDYPDCVKFLNKWKDECCPKATQEMIDASLQSYTCQDDTSQINAGCAAAMDPSIWSMVCDAVKENAACN